MVSRSLIGMVLLLVGCSESGDYLPPAGTTVAIASADSTYLQVDFTTGGIVESTISTVASGNKATFRRISRGTTPYYPRDEVTNSGISSLLLGAPQVEAHYLALTEITQAQWQALVGAAGIGTANPWAAATWAVPTGGNYPAANLGASEIESVLEAWNRRTSHTLRLPTSIEWENACRAGSATPWSWGTAESQAGTYARVRETQGGSSGAATVAGRSANAWGFFDLHGNLWEWVSDGGTDGAPCLRGGSWSDNLVSARSGNRLDMPETTAFPLAGVRLVLEIE